MMDTLDVCGNGWGKTNERMTRLSEEAWTRLQDFLAEHQGAPVNVEEKEGSLTFSNGKEGVLTVDAVHSRADQGGNAWNARVAMNKVVEELEPGLQGNIRFHSEVTRRRVNHVVSGPNGGEPKYFSKPPEPAETGPLPNAPHVFLSSGGPDVFQEIAAYFARNPKGNLYLAPGSKQVERGIPTWIFELLHFLSCNKAEAKALAAYLGEKSSEWTANDLLRFFGDLGVKEVRITDGENGVYAQSGRDQMHVPGIDRNAEILGELSQTLSKSRISTEHTLKHPNVNGCGDTRLGAELGMELAGEKDLKRRLGMGNILAALNTFNPGPNIARFPGQVIRDARELLAQLP